jgi:hypothetical protein
MVMVREKYVVLLFAIVLISGCVENTNNDSNTNSFYNTANITSETNNIVLPQVVSSFKYNPTNIKLFSSATEGDNIRFYFLLEDQNGQNTLGEGYAQLKIKDSTGNIMFTQEFDFKASDFIDYEFQLTGNDVGKAFEWRVNNKDIQKGISIGSADLRITLPYNNKTIYATDSYVQLPTYTAEEVKQLYEDRFNKSAKVIYTKEPQTIGNFQVSLIKYGYYTHLKYDTFGDEVTDFRVDLRVKNIGSGQNTFNTYNAVMLFDSNQYKASLFSSKLDTMDMYSGVVKEGYLIFEDVPKTLNGKIKIVAGTTYGPGYREIPAEFLVPV